MYDAGFVTIVWFQKISLPPLWRELEIVRVGEVMQRPRKFQRGVGLDDENHFPRG